MNQGKRIYDNPDHPNYGPIRRMWVILAQLDMLDIVVKHPAGTWDQWYSLILNNLHDNMGESWCARMILRQLIGE